MGDYLLYPAKKSGQAYFDFPSFAPEQQLNQTRVQQFCLVERKYRDEFSSSDDDTVQYTEEDSAGDSYTDFK